MPHPKTRSWFVLGVMLQLTTGCTTHRVVQSTATDIRSFPLNRGDVVKVARPGDLQGFRGYLSGRRERQGVVSDFSPEPGWMSIQSGGSTLQYSFPEIEKLSVLRGEKRPNTTMIKRSLITGAVVAGTFGLIALASSDRCTGFLCISDRDAALFLGFMFSVPGTVLGTLGGLLGTEKTWEELHVPPVGPRTHLPDAGQIGGFGS